MERKRDLKVDYDKLLRSCAKGDQSALQALFEVEAARMKGVARRMLLRDDLAEDAMQEAFVRIWQKAGRYDPDRGSALGWIYAVQRRIALNRLRSGTRDDLAAPDDINAVQDTRSQLQRADDIFERLATTGELRACLTSLDPQQRNALLLSYALGLSYGEIAGRMSSPLGTVKVWLRRGLASLRGDMS